MRMFTITLRNRYQVLEEEGPEIEEDEEVEPDFQVMEKAYIGAADPGKGKNHGSVKNHSAL